MLMPLLLIGFIIYAVNTNLGNKKYTWWQLHRAKNSQNMRIGEFLNYACPRRRTPPEIHAALRENMSNPLSNQAILDELFNSNSQCAFSLNGQHGANAYDAMETLRLIVEDYYLKLDPESITILSNYFNSINGDSFEDLLGFRERFGTAKLLPMYKTFLARPDLPRWFTIDLFPHLVQAMTRRQGKLDAECVNILHIALGNIWLTPDDFIHLATTKDRAVIDAILSAPNCPDELKVQFALIKGGDALPSPEA